MHRPRFGFQGGAVKTQNRKTFECRLKTLSELILKELRSTCLRMLVSPRLQKICHEASRLAGSQLRSALYKVAAVPGLELEEQGILAVDRSRTKPRKASREKLLSQTSQRLTLLVLFYLHAM